MCPLLLLSAVEASTSTQYAGAVGTNSWTNPSNAVGSEEVNCATSSSAISGFWKTFGFAIPTGAVINGITVELKVSKGVSQATEVFVVVGKDESTLGGEKTGAALTQTACGASQGVQSFGSASDKWSLSWTAADINSASFTVRVRTDDTRARNLNWVRVTVDYSASYTYTLTESVDTASAVARVVQQVKTVTGEFSLTSTPSKVVAAAKTLTEAAGFASTATSSFGRSVTLSESLDLSGIVQRVIAIVQAPTGLVDVTATVSEVLAKTITVASSFDATASATPIRDYIRGVTESASISATASRILSATVTLTEQLSLSAIVVLGGATVRTVTEGFSLESLLLVVKSISMTVSGSVSLSSTVQVLFQGGGQHDYSYIIAEGIALADKLIAIFTDPRSGGAGTCLTPFCGNPPTGDITQAANPTEGVLTGGFIIVLLVIIVGAALSWGGRGSKARRW